MAINNTGQRHKLITPKHHGNPDRDLARRPSRDRRDWRQM